MNRSRTARSQGALAIAALAGGAALWAGACERRADEGAGRAPRAAPAAGYVESSACAECHAAEARAWSGSHHDLAMQVAGPDTVLGDFDGAVFDDGLVRARFFRDGARYLVNTLGPDGAAADFEIAYTFGVDPLQQYLVPFPGGVLQCLTIAWDARAKRWFSLYPDERFEPGDPLHWTGAYQRWNSMCADCHSTVLTKAYDASADAYRTTWHEIDVGCQACHGPGAAHVAWARAGAAGADEGLVVQLSRAAPAATIDACARCHSRRSPLVDPFDPALAFLDGFAPERLHAGLYRADGQIDGEVYEWGSFAQSKMHANGVGCSDCHDPHGLDTWLPGDAVCSQCHTQSAPLERFPTLQPKAYDTPEHHHHAAGSSGASCIACHMPARTYMQIDVRHDHGFRIPRPDLSVATGAPNACTDCHSDRSNEWAAAAVAEWYGERAARRPLERDFAPGFARARLGLPEAAAELGATLRDPAASAIVRATAFELLGALERGPRLGEPELWAAGLADPDPLVRLGAANGLANGPEPGRLAALVSDPVRAVRLAAASALARRADLAPGPKEAPALAAALAEYEAAQALVGDLPSGPANLALLAAARGDHAAAVLHYRRALEIDPWFLPARFNLANLLDALGRPAEAEEVLRAGLERAANPAEEGELRRSLGLALGAQRRFADAALELARASELLPEQARIRYNLALVLSEEGRRDEAAALLRELAAADPSDLDSLVALIETLRAQGALPEALARARDLEAATAGAAWARALRAELEREDAAAARPR